MPEPRHILAFIASPSDLPVERQAFRDACEKLNQGFGDGASVRFEPLGWEDTLSTVGRRNQSVINQEIDRCDVFVLVLHRRWGQEAPDCSYSSYTEEEFHLALDRLKSTGKPEIFVFFKHVDPGQIADPGPQLQKVLAFRRELEDSHQVLYLTFSDPQEFQRQVDRHLRGFAKGNLLPRDLPSAPVILPIALREKLEEAQREAKRHADRANQLELRADQAVARAELLALNLAVSAAKAAEQGQVEQARQDFARATDGTTNLQVLYLAARFYHLTGELDAAEQMFSRQLAIIGEQKSSAKATVLQGLGIVHESRGDYAKAEFFANESLKMHEDLGQHDCVARQYANLGSIYLAIGRDDDAQAVLKKAGDAFLALDLLSDFVVAVGNLAIVAVRRNQFDYAEELIRRALACKVKLDREEGIARQYHNLGVLYAQQEKLDEAEGMISTSLKINEKLGDAEGIALNRMVLGVIQNERGNTASAQAVAEQSRDLFKKMGNNKMDGLLGDWLSRLKSVQD